jgi:multidrug efflux pump subunit AcrB
MKTISSFFIKNNKLTLVLTLFVFIFGLFSLRMLNAESYPSVNFAMATIKTMYRGASADDIEAKITKPIEDEIRKVSGLKDVKSVSQSGESNILVRVDMDNEDVDEVLSDLQKAVDRVSKLPQDLQERPVYKEINSEEFPAIELAIIGPNTNRSRDLLADTIKEDLEDSKSVLAVRLIGFEEREFSIRLNTTNLKRFHVSVTEVMNAIKSRNVNIPGGNIRDEKNENLIRVEAKVSTAAELSKLLIRTNFTGQKIYLKDVAVVMDSEKEKFVKARFNDQPATLAIVTKKAGADTIKLVEEVHRKLKKYQNSNEHKVLVYQDEASKVKNKLDVLSSNAFSGLGLVIIFLLIFLPGKIGLMASLSLPIAVLATMGFMPYLGMNIDSITVLALVIALGMLVDNSVVISEYFVRLKQEGHTAKEASLEAVKALWLPITATAFTTIGAFLPMLVTKGIMGQFIKYIPIIVSISLVLSLFESFFLLPMRLVTFGDSVKSVNDQNFKADWFHGITIKFENFMKVLVKWRYLVALAMTSLILGSLFMLVVVNKFILFPAEETEIYIARYETKAGSSLEFTEKVGAELVDKILNSEMKPHIEHVTLRIGSSTKGPSDPKAKTGPNVGLAFIYFTDKAAKVIDYTVALESFRKIKVEKTNSLVFEEWVNGPPVGEPINGTIRSNNPENLLAGVEAIKRQMENTKGIFDLNDDTIIEQPEIRIIIDYVTANRLGLTAQNIGNTVRTAFQGSVVSTVILNNKEVDLNVKFSKDNVKDIEFLKQLEIADRKGNLVPLSRIAKLEKVEGTPQIKRFDFKRSKTITGSVDPNFITSQKANKLLATIFEKINKDLPDLSLVFGGEEENKRESLQSLAQAQVLALIAIFGILVFIFNSFIRPFIIMATIPLGLVGFSVAFYFHDRPVSFLSLIGVIGLAGIIVNSGIVLISFIDQLKEEGKLEFEEILAKASGMRLRAVLVTSLTTISGLFPTAYGVGGSDPMLVPMTLAMFWGLTSGTFLTLIWVPCAYGILEDFTQFSNRIVNKIKNKAASRSISSPEVTNE